MWRSHGFPKKVIYKCYDFLMFLYTGYGYIVTLPELPGSMRITSVYMGILKKNVGCFPFSPGVSAMFLVFIPTHLPPGLCLAHHLVVSRCHPSVASLFGACSGGAASVGDARVDGCEKL